MNVNMTNRELMLVLGTRRARRRAHARPGANRAEERGADGHGGEDPALAPPTSLPRTSATSRTQEPRI